MGRLLIDDDFLVSSPCSLFDQRQRLAKVLLYYLPMYCDVCKYFICQGLFALATRWLLRSEGRNAFRVFISKTRPLDLCYPLILLSTCLTLKYILIFIDAIHNCLYCLLITLQMF